MSFKAKEALYAALMQERYRMVRQCHYHPYPGHYRFSDPADAQRWLALVLVQAAIFSDVEGGK